MSYSSRLSSPRRVLRGHKDKQEPDEARWWWWWGGPIREKGGVLYVATPGGRTHSTGSCSPTRRATAGGGGSRMGRTRGEGGPTHSHRRLYSRAEKSAHFIGVQ